MAAGKPWTHDELLIADTFDEDFRLVIGPWLKAYLPDAALEREFLVYEGQRLQMPDKFLPEAEFMRWHRDEVMHG